MQWLKESCLAIGEPPATKGYPPFSFRRTTETFGKSFSVSDKGTITGLYTVLVDGDDMNEPIADAVRGILDVARGIKQENSKCKIIIPQLTF